MILSLVSNVVRRLRPRNTIRPQRPRRTILRVEVLDERAVPATFKITTLADSHDANPGNGTALD